MCVCERERERGREREGEREGVLLFEGRKRVLRSDTCLQIGSVREVLMSPSPSLTVANDQHVSQETKKDFFSKKDSREQN